MASIRKISENSYKITVSCGRDAANKQQRHYMTWKPDRPMTEKQMEKAAQKAAYEFEKQINLGFRPDDSRTFRDFAEYFIDLKRQHGISARTIESYEWAKRRIYDSIGDMRLVDIRPYHLNKLYVKIAKSGKFSHRGYCYPVTEIRPLINDRGGVVAFEQETGIHSHIVTRCCRGERITQESGVRMADALGLDFKTAFQTEANEKETLSNSAIEKHHAFVRMVLDEAEKNMIITYNPARRVTVPKIEKEGGEKEKCLQPEELKAVLEALEDEETRTQAVIYTLLYTGMRRGELCALKWDKIDFEARQITVDAAVSYTKETGAVFGKTKTRNARRVPIGDDFAAVLKAYRSWYIQERFRLCGAWEDHNFVFCCWDGEMMVPGIVNYILSKFCKKNNLPHIHPHQFRHTAASLMIANGTDVVTVADILGHKNTSMTLAVYAHAIDTAKEKAANTMESAIEACKIG